MMINTVKQMIEKDYVLKERDMGELKEIHKGMYHFYNHSYSIIGIGSLFTMELRAMLGLMKMQTIVISPQYKNLDFCNVDAIHAMANDTLILEMYRSSTQTADLSEFDDLASRVKNLTDYESAPRWYDSYKRSSCISKKGVGARRIHQELTKQYIGIYLDLLKKAPYCDYSEKQQLTNEYVSQLIENGGVAVDSLTKMIGSELTATLINRFMFNVKD